MFSFTTISIMVGISYLVSALLPKNWTDEDIQAALDQYKRENNMRALR